MLAAALLLSASPSPAGGSQPPAAGGHAVSAGKPAAEGGHEAGSPIVGTIARLFNFAILAGTLVYFLRSPIATYLRERGTQIRGDLVKAADMRLSATARLAAIDEKMAALPAELETLRTESRMRQAAESERTRLLDQARREIDARVKIARRDLVGHTADLAVGIASARLKATITAADQARLVDRYLGQLGRAQGPAGQVTA
jgi:F0F1-type ATP synthase membrane subunit b/b'